MKYSLLLMAFILLCGAFDFINEVQIRIIITISDSVHVSGVKYLVVKWISEIN